MTLGDVCLYADWGAWPYADNVGQGELPGTDPEGRISTATATTALSQ